MSVSNKAQVEGSIANAYLVEEASKFCTHYFETSIYTRPRKVSRNDDEEDPPTTHGTFNVFCEPGRPFGQSKDRYLVDKEYEAIHRYILLNCDETTPYQK